MFRSNFCKVATKVVRRVHKIFLVSSEFSVFCYRFGDDPDLNDSDDILSGEDDTLFEKCDITGDRTNRTLRSG